MPRARRVGLTGGIASGKSTVSARLAELGAVVIDYDRLARDVVEPGSPALDQIAARFGADVIAPDGTLVRPALGAIVFADPSALKDLEAITHPAIRDLAAAREQGAGPDAIVVHDNPLLVEMGAAAACDVVIVVDVPEQLQIDRMVRDRQMTEQDARARIAAQASREERLAVADVVIENTGTLEQLSARIDEVWKDLVEPSAR
ncbi:dephospho-CoA kinase [Aeromicrobium senzhongii]|uniref:Dephospho-CoA kinase n=1 Tax=Aeromicrobium senzhongii TaxID=2663859 RepID=A0ABX6SQ30_9ACTN|nr:dephospho-CoA kinase [Aeromicrobium senzhongii]MTB86898.1 dephospho-CoA kinase [Aeromicrobium senzhongii]QNL93268.1 dephospho-CoA kinase [Aeromicrobium senzhongii]